jgi:hypothetical protein
LRFSLDHDLHPFDLLEIQDEGVDNGVQGGSLCGHTSEMGARELGAEIHVSGSLFGHKEVKQTGSFRNRRDEIRPLRPLQEPSKQGLGCGKGIAGLNTSFLSSEVVSANGAEVELHSPPWGFVHGDRFGHLRAEHPSLIVTGQPTPCKDGGSKP